MPSIVGVSFLESKPPNIASPFLFIPTSYYIFQTIYLVNIYHNTLIILIHYAMFAANINIPLRLLL